MAHESFRIYYDSLYAKPCKMSQKMSNISKKDCCKLLIGD